MSECKTCNYTYVGKGKVYAETDGVRLRYLSNISKLDISASINTDKVVDSTQGGGGNCAIRSYVESSNTSMDLWNYCPENFALMTGGKTTDSSISTVVDEAHKGYAGGLLPFNELFDKTIAPVVKKGANTLVAGTDYDLTETGIIPISGGAISDGNDLLISYTSVASSTVQALTDIGKKMKLVFEGLNDAQSGKRVRVTIYRFQPSPSDTIPFITDSFTPASVGGENLRDSSVTGVGESQFYKTEIEHV